MPSEQRRPGFGNGPRRVGHYAEKPPEKVGRWTPRVPAEKELGRKPAQAEMGKVMALAKARLAGKADMGQVSAAVKAALQG